MKIKLAILEQDKNYLERIVHVFHTRYADEIEVYSFTEEDTAFAAINDMKVDVLLANEWFDIDTSVLPERCRFAYLVDSHGIDTVNEQRAICKFQKVDLIYKEITSIYAEKAVGIATANQEEGRTKVLMFASPSGGTGNSSMAAACATHFSKQGKRCFYLNLEKFSSTDIFFQGDGAHSMSDIIFFLKSKKANLSTKLESCVKQDISGVCFYGAARNALDMMELKMEDIQRLISEIRMTGTYDYIVVDMDFGITKEYLRLFRKAHQIIWISDGTTVSNRKIMMAYCALETKEQEDRRTILSKTSLIYNKFNNKTSKVIDDIRIQNIGGTPRFEGADERTVVEHLSNMNFFQMIE